MSLLLDYIIPFLVLLGVLISIHEFGHYWAARRCGVRILAFSIGFGPELFGWTDRSGTRWRVAAVPLGGYVRMLGEGAEAGSGEGSQPDAFASKALPQRTLIVAAGPAANFLFAIVLAAALYMIHGQQYTPPVVTGILEDSAAEAAGVLPGDRFVSLGGATVSRFEDIQALVGPNPGRTLDAVVERGAATLRFPVTLGSVERTDGFGNAQRFGLLGIRGTERETVRRGPVRALVESVGHTWAVSGMILGFIWEMLAGERSTDELGGVLRIGHIAGEVAKIDFRTYLDFMVLFSINLGIINLLPIPMLDGGHLAFYAVEALRGRPLGARAQEIGTRIGLAVVVGLMVLVTWNDLVYFRVVSFLEQLVG